MNNKNLSSLLNLVLIMLSAIGAIFYFLIVPILGSDLARRNPAYAGAFWPWLILIWITGAAYYYVLYQGHIIFKEIGQDNSFSKTNTDALRRISRCALITSILFFGGNIIYMLLGLNHISLFLLSLAVTALGITLTVFASSLSQLVIKARELKEANDLTI